MAALLLARAVYGRVGVADLVTRIAKWRLPSRWYLIVLILPLALALASLMLGSVAASFRLGPLDPRVPWGSFVPFLLYMLVWTGLVEEPGWRGFALPHAQA